jgi:hypothetical protein
LPIEHKLTVPDVEQKKGKRVAQAAMAASVVDEM